MKIVKSYQHETIEYFKLGYSPVGKPTMYVHFYYLEGLLIDTGQPNMKREVLDILKNRPIETCIITHHHEDHSGNLPLLQKQYTFPTFTHEIGCKLLPNPRRVSFAERMIWGQNKPSTAQPIGDSFSFKDYQFEVIFTPGHAEDHICLLDHDRGWLFAGDIYVNDYIKFFGFYESMYGQIQSLKKLLTYDFEFIFCGHNPILKNGKARIAGKLQFFEDYFGKVQREYEKGYTAKQIMKSLKIKEDKFIKFSSQGQLSAEQMVKSVIRDLEQLKMEN